MSKPKPKEYWYLCAECAEKKGGTWDDGFVATFHMGTCHVCEHHKSLACVSDWNLDCHLKNRKAKAHDRD